MMVDQFVNKYINKSLEVEDSSAPYQCMDLAFAWCDTIGLDRAQIRNQYAKDVWTHHGNLLVPTLHPQPGDFVIWGTLVGSAGHIAMYLSGDPATQFQSFDQNWNLIQKCLKVNHTNYGVLGILHPTILEGEDMLTPAEVNQLAQIAFNRPATDAEKYTYNTIPIAEALQRILTGGENLSLRTDAQAYRDANTPVSEAQKKLQQITQIVNS